MAIQDGGRESTLSWRELLRDLKRRGLAQAPALCVADGALGLWAAMAEELPALKEQRCWVHKTGNVLDKMPKKVQPAAKRLIQEMYMSPTRAAALEAVPGNSWRSTGRSTRRPASAWPRTRTCSSPSTISGRAPAAPQDDQPH